MPGYLILLKRTTVESAATYCEASTKEEAEQKAIAKADAASLIWEPEKHSAGRAHVAIIELVDRAAHDRATDRL
jgi:hypothetical protein